MSCCSEILKSPVEDVDEVRVNMVLEENVETWTAMVEKLAELRDGKWVGAGVTPVGAYRFKLEQAIQIL